MNCQTTEKGKNTSKFKFFVRKSKELLLKFLSTISNFSKKVSGHKFKKLPEPSFYNVFVHFLADIWPRIESVLLITLENEKVQE